MAIEKTAPGGGGGPGGRSRRPYSNAPAVDGQGQPPVDREAEEAVAGALLFFADETAPQVLTSLTAEDFYTEKARRVFLAAQAIAARGETPNLVTVGYELRHAGELPDDLYTWAGQARDTLLSVAFLPVFIKGVREAADRRRVRAALLEALDRVTVEDPGTLAGEVAEKLAALGQGRRPGREPTLVRLADVEPEGVSWLWEPYIARGKLTLLEGDPGVGKSWLALALATIVSRGWPFPGPDGIPRQEQVQEPANVLYLSAEDGVADTIRVRLDAAGADVGRVYVLTGWTAQGESGERLDGYVTLQDINLLEETLNRIRPALLVVDPVQGFLGEVDAWRAEQVRPILARVGELAARFRCAVLLIRHLSKSAKDRAIYRGLGSIDFSAAARSVLAVLRRDEERGLVHVKSSLAPEGPSLAFDLVGGRFVWIGPSKLTKADVNAPEGPPEDRTQAEECADFLRDLLADGPRPAQEVIRLAARAGYRGGTLDRGKALAGVKARSKRGPGGRLEGWEWFLSPGHEPPLHQSPTSSPIRAGALVSGAPKPSAATVSPDNHQGTSMVLWEETGETVGPQGFRDQSARAPQKIGGPPDALGGVVEEEGYL